MVLERDALQIRLSVERLKDVVCHALVDINLKEKAQIDALVEKTIGEIDLEGMIRAATEDAMRETITYAVKGAIQSLFWKKEVRDVIRKVAIEAISEPHPKEEEVSEDA